MLIPLRPFPILLITLLAAPAAASDGVVEINHACALRGCFAGDQAGYPVTITAEGSYRLTSDLVVPAQTNGIQVANDVSIDLNQFAVRGPVGCCPATTTPGSGIVSSGAGGLRVSVRNGKIRGFGLDGIKLGSHARVEGVTFRDILQNAIDVDAGSYVEKNLIAAVGGHGILFRGGIPSLYRDNVISAVGQVGAGGQSVQGGRASGPNVCTDQLCGTSGKKLFYLTTGTYDGARADSACATGFHMASMWEIFDVSELEYDTTRGIVNADSGQGPPTFSGGPTESAGWIRTGFASMNASASANGEGNCLGWSSVEGLGTLARLEAVWFQDPTAVAPWESTVLSCYYLRPVWCIQN